MAAFKAAYLIHGDDHGRIAERRARLRAMAEADSGSGGVEVLEGDDAAPASVALALSSMTFAIGRRFVIVDGVERWKEADVAPVAEALAGADGETVTAAFFAREEGRYKAPKSLHAAVKAAGGAIAVEVTVKPWELPKWVAERARELDLQLERGAAKALVTRVGDRQQRLLRELEKLALAHDPGASLSEDEVTEEAASSAERKKWTLADALVAGDERTATRTLAELRAQGERVPGLVYTIAGRLRDADTVARALAAGQSEAQARRLVRMPPKAAERFVADVAKAEPDRFRRALEALADLEVDSRGGGELCEDTAAVLAVSAMAR